MGGRGEVECEREARREHEAQSLGSCREHLQGHYCFFFVFYVHQMNAKILIGQN